MPSFDDQPTPRRPLAPSRARSPRDTLDDADRHEDAVHELTDPLDPLGEAPTDHRVPDAEAPTDVLGEREIPTGPAENRTAPWMHAAPWKNPDVPEEPKADSVLLPFVVFVAVLLACIAVFVYRQTHAAP